MPNNYTFLDSNSSVQTAGTSVVSGAHQPLVQIQSVLTAVPVSFSGSPSISGAVTVVGNPSISGTVNVAGIPSISGTVNVAGNPSVSGTVDIGTMPSVYGNVSGSVAAFIQGTPNVNAAGSVVSFQGGAWAASIVGAPVFAEDAGHTTADKGLFTLAVRNDAVASFVGTDLDYAPNAVDSAGRVLTKPFAAEESRIEGYASVVSTSVTTLVAAAGAGLRNYITDIFVANTGAATTLVTFSSGGGASVLGYTIAPTAGGSNLPGVATPFRTLANQTFGFQATTATSVLYVTVKGYKAP